MSSVSNLSRRSLKGRPRILTDEEIKDLLDWADSRQTVAQKAAEAGISAGTLHIIIKTRGEHYKQPSPELREQTAVARRQRREAMLAANHV